MSGSRNVGFSLEAAIFRRSLTGWFETPLPLSAALLHCFLPALVTPCLESGLQSKGPRWVIFSVTANLQKLKTDDLVLMATMSLVKHCLEFGLQSKRPGRLIKVTTGWQSIFKTFFRIRMRFRIKSAMMILKWWFPVSHLFPKKCDKVWIGLLPDPKKGIPLRKMFCTSWNDFH